MQASLSKVPIQFRDPQPHRPSDPPLPISNLDLRDIMNGNDIKKAAINKAKQVATAANNAANGNNGGKKRRKGQDLKPIITTEDQQSANGSPNNTANMDR